MPNYSSYTCKHIIYVNINNKDDYIWYNNIDRKSQKQKVNEFVVENRKESGR